MHSMLTGPLHIFTMSKDAGRATGGAQNTEEADIESEQFLEQIREKARAAACSCGVFKARTLERAVEKGCLRCCVKHVEEAKGRDGKSGRPSPLMQAVKRGQIEIARLLLLHQVGGFADEEDIAVSAFAHCIGNPELWKLFSKDVSEDDVARLEAGRSSICTCERRSGALLDAAKSGCLGCCVHYIFEVEKKDIYCHLKTALMHAAERGHPDVARLLMRRQAGRRDSYKRTALMFAAQNGQTEVARLLISREAGMIDGQGWSAACYAAMYFQRECATLLMADEKEAEGIPAQMVAAYRGDYRAMLETRDKWKETLGEDVTILHFAFLGGNERCMRLLLQEAEMLEFFANKEFDFSFTKGDPSKEVRCLLPVLAMQWGQKASDRVFDLLFDENETSTRALAPFCAFLRSWRFREQIRQCESFATFVMLLKLVKNVGSIFECQTILGPSVPCKKEHEDFVSQNPIFSKQMQLARKQIARSTFIDEHGRQHDRRLPEDIQFSVREIRSEAAFNRFILLASRDVSWKSISSQRRVEEPRASTLRPKQERNRLLIRNTVAYVKAQLRKMMNE